MPEPTPIPRVNAEPIGWEPNQDGVWFDLPARTYRQAPGDSNSSLKHLDPPARYPEKMAEKVEATPWMRMGTLVHSAILEPEKPLPRLVLKPETYPAPAHHADVKKGIIKAGDPIKWSGNAKWCKAWVDAQDAAGNEVMTAEEFKDFQECVSALLNDDESAALFSEGFGEVSVFAGLTLPSRRFVRRKARLDWVRPPVIPDVKVIQEGMGAREFFETLAYDRRHYVQAAYYIDTWNDAVDLDNQVNSFVFVAVERCAPYLVSRFEVAIGSETYRAGRDQYIQDLEALAECRETGIWPGYPPGFQPLGLPSRVRRKARH